MEALLNFLQNENEGTNVGYGLLVAFALVYLGMAVLSTLSPETEHCLLIDAGVQRHLLSQGLPKRRHYPWRSYRQYLQVNFV